MAFTREHIRESIERAGDEHWEALVRHHTEVYPESNPTPGDVCRAEAERLNDLGLGENPDLALVESRVERVAPAVRIVSCFRGSRERYPVRNRAVHQLRVSLAGTRKRRAQRCSVSIVATLLLSMRMGRTPARATRANRVI